MDDRRFTGPVRGTRPTAVDRQPHESSDGGRRMRRLAGAGAMSGLLVLAVAGTALGGLVGGSLPAAGFTFTSVTTDSVRSKGGGISLKAKASINVKTTYSRVAAASWAGFDPGWHYHAGPTIVTVTVGTLTFYDEECRPFDVSAGDSYIEANGEVVNARIHASKNTAGNTTVEFFTVRLYPAEALDPNPVPAPCTP